MSKRYDKDEIESQLNNLKNYADKASKDYAPPNTLDFCPSCGCERLTKAKDGDNRYKCNGCSTTVSSTSHTLAKKTHLPTEKRVELKEAFDEGKSVRRTAEDVGVNKNTVISWFSKFRGIEE